MSRDEEAQLFAEEMAQSRRRFDNAVRRQAFETYSMVHGQSATARARARQLTETSAILGEVSRGLRAASASLREYYKRASIPVIRAPLRGFRDG
jgi:hypothetical protein